MGKGWDTLPAKEFGWAADVRRHPSDDVRRAAEMTGLRPCCPNLMRQATTWPVKHTLVAPESGMPAP
jgi:hypothetical protein